jgi:hypothetical protein
VSDGRAVDEALVALVAAEREQEAHTAVAEMVRRLHLDGFMTRAAKLLGADPLEMVVRQATVAIRRFRAEAHGGAAWAESAPGVSAAFFFSLPAGPATAAPA